MLTLDLLLILLEYFSLEIPMLAKPNFSYLILPFLFAKVTGPVAYIYSLTPLLFKL
jgi:hypothetical protein